MSRSRGKTIAWVVAITVATVGLGIVVVGASVPASVGWFAYQPLAGATFRGGVDGVIVNRLTLVGALILGLGLLAAALLAGMRAGAAGSTESR